MPNVIPTCKKNNFHSSVVSVTHTHITHRRASAARAPAVCDVWVWPVCVRCFYSCVINSWTHGTTYRFSHKKEILEIYYIYIYMYVYVLPACICDLPSDTHSHTMWDTWMHWWCDIISTLLFSSLFNRPKCSSRDTCSVCRFKLPYSWTEHETWGTSSVIHICLSLKSFDTIFGRSEQGAATSESKKTEKNVNIHHRLLFPIPSIAFYSLTHDTVGLYSFKVIILQFAISSWSFWGGLPMSFYVLRFKLKIHKKWAIKCVQFYRIILRTKLADTHINHLTLTVACSHRKKRL